MKPKTFVTNLRRSRNAVSSSLTPRVTVCNMQVITLIHGGPNHKRAEYFSSGGARVSTQGGHKIFFGAPHVRKFFDDLFLLLPPISPIFSTSTTRQGGAVRVLLGAPSLQARAPGGHDAPPCPPWLRHCIMPLLYQA
jgi:hypothetical protein